MTLRFPLILALAATAACAEGEAPDAEGTAAGVVAPAQAATQASAKTGAHPPLGKYVCRQYMTTIGYITLTPDSYSVGSVRGDYSYEPDTGGIAWTSGAYAGWPARYEFSPAGEGHAHDEDIIRMTDESGKLKIDCFLMRD